MKATCKNSANLEQETKTTKIVTYPLLSLASSHVCTSQPPTFFISCPVQKLLTALLRHQNLSEHVRIKAHLGRLYNGLVNKCLLHCYSFISCYVTKKSSVCRWQTFGKLVPKDICWALTFNLSFVSLIILKHP